MRAIDIILDSQGTMKPWATVAMLFQMVFEKVAKAAFARAGEQGFKSTLGKHSSLSKFLKATSNQSKYTNLHRQPTKVLLAKLKALEALNPAEAKLGHLEYPWEEGGLVKLPTELPIVQELANPLSSWAPKARRLAWQFLDEFDSIF
jgi:hypothetical protein